MNSAAQVGFVLLGVYFTVSGVAGLTSLPELLATIDKDSAEYVWVKNPGFVLAARVSGVVLLRIVPGLLLIRFRAQLAQRIFPQDGDASPTAAQLYVAGCALLAFYLGVVGVAGIVSGTAALVGLWLSGAIKYGWSFFLGQPFGSLAKAGCALLLYRHALSRSAQLPSDILAAVPPPREYACGYCNSRFTSNDQVWDELLASHRCPNCAQPVK